MNNILKKNFVVLLLLISIYALFVIYNKKPITYGNNINEGFTSGIREMYRPRVRSARLIVEGYYSKAKNNFRLILKKFGIV
jgi:hypothetical protein